MHKRVSKTSLESSRVFFQASKQAWGKKKDLVALKSQVIKIIIKCVC